jgi:ribosomal protein L25 (general stress protein Ctc)
VNCDKSTLQTEQGLPLSASRRHRQADSVPQSVFGAETAASLIAIGSQLRLSIIRLNILNATILFCSRQSPFPVLR